MTLLFIGIALKFFVICCLFYMQNKRLEKKADDLEKRLRKSNKLRSLHWAEIKQMKDERNTHN